MCQDPSPLPHRSSGLDNQVHLLVARWPQVQLSDNSTTVICAIALGLSVTQWTHSATLIVLPSTPTPSPHQNQTGPVALLGGLVVGAMLVVLTSLVAVSIVWYCLKRKHRSHLQHPDEGMDSH